MAVDLDALAAELTAAEIDSYVDDWGRLNIGSQSIWYLHLPHIGGSSWADDYWKAITIIARHVSPEPHDAARLRETIKEIVQTEDDKQRPAWGDYISDELAYSIADAVIRAIGDAR